MRSWLLVLVLASTVVAQSAEAQGAGSFGAVQFGDNPGALEMFRYVPSPEPPAGAPLVFALHGCTVNATVFRAAGWEELADQYGFYVVYPQQPAANNPVGCFNWAGEYGDVTNLIRGMGENQSIIGMIEKMTQDHGIDAERVFITGHSAGAAEVAVMLATWPDAFAGGGIVAGVPYRCATSVLEAFQCQSPGVDKSADAWGSLVRDAFSGYSGPYPRVSIWHGTTDGIVAPKNQEELIEQWTNVHGTDQTPDMTEMRDGYPWEGYTDSAGNLVVENWVITGEGHATFNDPDSGCGSTGAYISDADVCAPLRMAEFFGLTGAPPPGGDPPGGNPPGDNPPSGGNPPGGNPPMNPPVDGGQRDAGNRPDASAPMSTPPDEDYFCRCSAPGAPTKAGLGAYGSIAAVLLLALRLQRRRTRRTGQQTGTR